MLGSLAEIMRSGLAWPSRARWECDRTRCRLSARSSVTLRRARSRPCSTGSRSKCRGCSSTTPVPPERSPGYRRLSSSRATRSGSERTGKRAGVVTPDEARNACAVRRSHSSIVRCHRGEEAAMHAPDTWHRVRIIAYWTFTAIVVFELVAGSVWNLKQIEWVRLQLSHLGYPLYFAYISGVWQVGAAVALIAPGFPRLKDWAYAGAFFQWSGAVASHLLAGDGNGPASVWVTPLMFAVCAIASWALRPTDRGLPNAGLAPATRPLAWAVPTGTLLLMFVVSYLT